MSAGPSNVCVCHLFDCLDISVCVYLYRSVYTCSKGRAKKWGGQRSCPKRPAFRVWEKERSSWMSWNWCFSVRVCAINVVYFCLCLGSVWLVRWEWVWTCVCLSEVWTNDCQLRVCECTIILLFAQDYTNESNQSCLWLWHQTNLIWFKPGVWFITSTFSHTVSLLHVQMTDDKKA
jgi:hypothetical protein